MRVSFGFCCIKRGRIERISIFLFTSLFDFAVRRAEGLSGHYYVYARIYYIEIEIFGGRGIAMKELRGYGKSESDTERMYREAQRKFGGMNEDALVDRLLREIARQKSEGTFDEVQLLGFINTLSPHLSAEKRRRLEEILGRIDE